MGVFRRILGPDQGLAVCFAAGALSKTRSMLLRMLAKLLRRKSSPFPPLSRLDATFPRPEVCGPLVPAANLRTPAG
jgi:hypothetical protein